MSDDNGRYFHSRSEERARDGEPGAYHHETSDQRIGNYPDVAPKLEEHIRETGDKSAVWMKC